MTAICPRCHTIHCAADTRTVGRFNPAGPAGYQANHPDAPLRATRVEALRDVCDERTAAA